MASYFILIDADGNLITVDPSTQALLVQLVAGSDGASVVPEDDSGSRWDWT